MTTKIYIVLLFIASIVVIACSEDKIVEETLECDEVISYQDVKGVIAASCGYVGCHNGSNAANYDTYEKLENVLSSGKFTSRTLLQRDMPPGEAEGDPNLEPPDPNPTFLTDEEINLLKCWEENGFSEF